MGLPDPGMKIEVGNTALIVTDPQNDFLSPTVLRGSSPVRARFGQRRGDHRRHQRAHPAMMLRKSF